MLLLILQTALNPSTDVLVGGHLQAKADPPPRCCFGYLKQICPLKSVSYIVVLMQWKQCLLATAVGGKSVQKEAELVKVQLHRHHTPLSFVRASEQNLHL